ncbi:nickel ABC transporter permease [Microvirga antarctica]|uniref:nickel ABC transporter permease n=1 Tax=Microvirga antarctica TaxID=2819233 RepID=UPI001B30F2FC|nr:nickel ABC transporter permease [Microvirga antarctica]
MSRYLLSRVMQLIPVLFIISLVVFAIMHVLPGDPAELMLAGAEGGAITPERLMELKEQMGLNDPLVVQFGRFIGGALVGDLGESIRFRTPVTELILDRFGSTIALSLGGLFISLAVGLPLGMLAAVRQNSWIDVFAMGFAYVGASMPVYWVGLVMILLFSFNLGWFPPAGADSWRSLVLPAMTLGIVSAGVISRLIRSSMVEVLSEDYIRAARAKGLGERLILWRHGLKNAMIPVITMLGLQFGAMLAGAVVIETVFSRPGIGRLVVSAILQKDYPLVQGCIVFLAAVYLLVNLLVDLAYAWLDPRIRYGA